MSEPKYILVTGGRGFKNVSVCRIAMCSALDNVGDVIFVNGGATGADAICISQAILLQVPVFTYPAQWSRYGNAAGIIRNSQMLASHNIQLTLAFHDFLPNSAGTYDMCQKSLEQMIPVMHYTDDGLFAIYKDPGELPPRKYSKG